jgi:peptidyl-dipeptidase Dcp
LIGIYIKFLKDCEYASSYLWTTNELGAAAHLYMKYGFVLTEEKASDAFGKKVLENRYDLILKK